MSEKVVVVDRGVDKVLIMDGQIINITKLSGKRLIELLNKHQLTDIQTVSFDEYKSSIEYNYLI